VVNILRFGVVNMLRFRVVSLNRFQVVSMSVFSMTAQQMNIQPEFIEKDYWLTFALYLIFQHDIGNETVFKGGTALSKCYGIIERFSEDIDLVILRSKEETTTKLKRKLKQITEVVAEQFEELPMPGITNKMGMIRKVAYDYEKE